MNKKMFYITGGIIGAIVIGIIVAVIVMMNGTSSVAKVGDQKVTKAEYIIYLKMAQYQIMQQAQSQEIDWESQVAGQKLSDLVRSMAFDKAVETKIELAKAKELKITLDSTEEKTVKDQIDSIVQTYGSKTEAEKQIKAELDVTLAEYEKFVRNDTLAQKYKASESAKTVVSDDEIKDYYTKNPDEFDKATVKHILISTVDADGTTPLSDDKIKEAEKKAKEILAKVQAGGDFAALAKEFSTDTGSKDTGGEYTFIKGEMVTEFENWAFGTRKANDTDIVKTTFGYHVMKFVKREVTSLEAAKDTIKSSVTATKFSEEYAKQLEEWKKESKYAVTKDEEAISAILVK